MMLPILRTNWNGVLEELLKNEMGYGFTHESCAYLKPAVNILEEQDTFTLEVAAPGFEKNDFKIKLENKVLTIFSEKESKEDVSGKKYLRKEFGHDSFKRSFTLPETIDPDSISASYNNGVLTLSISKKEEAKVKPVREIEIA